VWLRHHEHVQVGVIDVGSNTVRLKVADGERELVSVREMLRLGADVEELGSISETKLLLAASTVRRFAAIGREHGAEDMEILITSPGRQARNGKQLLDALVDAGDCPGRILSAVEEGILAFRGAISVASPPARRRVAVVDVGGGSAQVVVGSRREGPVWAHSIDIGSQRLTNRLLRDDPPGLDAIGAARAEVDLYLEGLAPPEPQNVYAVGGSARALKRLAGNRLDAWELEQLLVLLGTTPTAELVAEHDADPERVRTMAAGAVILTELQARLGAPFKVVRAGLREGAIVELGAARAAA
jgi:exopolyphosphatase/guanosine-5'-triphosphate,3'-diphosphate pyrophosphatase